MHIVHKMVQQGALFVCFTMQVVGKYSFEGHFGCEAREPLNLSTEVYLPLVGVSRRHTHLQKHTSIHTFGDDPCGEVVQRCVELLSIREQRRSPRTEKPAQA